MIFQKSLYDVNNSSRVSIEFFYAENFKFLYQGFVFASENEKGKYFDLKFQNVSIWIHWLCDALIYIFHI